jgi:hypothetical protein
MVQTVDTAVLRQLVPFCGTTFTGAERFAKRGITTRTPYSGVVPLLRVVTFVTSFVPTRVDVFGGTMRVSIRGVVPPRVARHEPSVGLAVADVRVPFGSVTVHVGLLCVLVLGGHLEFAAMLALGLSLVVMRACHCLHPPACATAMIIVLEPTVQTWKFLFFPVLFGAIVVVLAAWGVHLIEERMLHNRLEGRTPPAPPA